MSDATESTIETTEAIETDAAEVVEGQDALGDPGKRALDAMKAQRKAAQDEAKAYKAELDALKAQAQGREAEHAAEIEKQRIKDEALGAANHRILRSELKAAATGKLADPSDAALYLDLSEFTVSDDGDVDSDALDAAISDLLVRKPHLSAKAGRFDGTVDQGPRGQREPSQLTEAEVENIKDPAEINRLRREGRLDRYLGIKH